MDEISASLNSALFWSWKERKKKKRLDETHFFTIPIWILKVTIQTSILRIMFFSLCRAVRTTAKKKKKKKKDYNPTMARVRRFFFITIGSNFEIWLASSFFDRNFLHAFLIIPLRSYENIFLEVSTPQIVLCFLYIRARHRRSNNAFQLDLSPQLYFPRPRASTSSDLKTHGLLHKIDFVLSYF